MSTLGKHINNAYAQFGNVFIRLFQLGTKLNSTKHLDNKDNK